MELQHGKRGGTDKGAEGKGNAPGGVRKHTRRSCTRGAREVQRLGDTLRGSSNSLEAEALWLLAEGW